jgi:hypothetical protein
MEMNSSTFDPWAVYFAKELEWELYTNALAMSLGLDMEKDLKPLPQPKHVSFSTDPPVKFVSGWELDRIPSRGAILAQDPEAKLRAIDLLRKVKGDYPEAIMDKLLGRSVWLKQKRDAMDMSVESSGNLKRSLEPEEGGSEEHGRPIRRRRPTWKVLENQHKNSI